MPDLCIHTHARGTFFQGRSKYFTVNFNSLFWLNIFYGGPNLMWQCQHINTNRKKKNRATQLNHWLDAKTAYYRGDVHRLHNAEAWTPCWIFMHLGLSPFPAFKWPITNYTWKWDQSFALCSMACHIVQLFMVVFLGIDLNTHHMHLCALSLLGVQTTNMQLQSSTDIPDTVRIVQYWTEIKVSSELLAKRCKKVPIPSMSASLIKPNKCETL